MTRSRIEWSDTFVASRRTEEVSTHARQEANAREKAMKTHLGTKMNEAHGI